jgi:hypothetical protein
MTSTACPTLRVDSVRKIFDDGAHNAFTDLCRYQDRLYLCFRSSPTSHEVLSDSSIVVLSSGDLGRSWREAHRFGVEGRDVRDPHFLVFRGRLLIYTGTWLCDGRKDLRDHLGYVAWTDDGDRWSGPRDMPSTQGSYVWRAESFADRAYLVGYIRRHIPDGQGGGRAGGRTVLLVSDDGFDWIPAGNFEEILGNECGFTFLDDGEVLAISRQRQSALLCRGHPPYQQWTRKELGRFIGGPMIARWGQRLLVGGRKLQAPREQDQKPRTVLSWLVNDTLVDAAELPSGGDNSYTGFVPLDNARGLLSYYSSHEGSGGKTAPCSIYFAELSSH